MQFALQIFFCAMIDWNCNPYYINTGKVISVKSLPLHCLNWSTWELCTSCSCDAPQHFTVYMQFKRDTIYIFHPTKMLFLLTLSPDTWIRCSHFSPGFFMGINSQILSFLLGQVSITKPKGGWHAAPVWGPRDKRTFPSLSLCKALPSRSVFTQDIFH